MRYLKRFDESKGIRSSITKDDYDKIILDINYILQDILDQGCSLNISSYGDSLSPGYKNGVLALDYCITIEVKSTRSNWFSMDGEAFNIKDILLQLNSYLSEYDCKLKVLCYDKKGVNHNYIDVDRISDNYLWSGGLFMQIVQKNEKGWISKIFNRE